MRVFFGFIKWFFTLCLVVALAGGWLFYKDATSPLVFEKDRIDFQITPGSSLKIAIREISSAGVTLNPWTFRLLGKFMRAESAIKAGSYEIRQGITPWELLEKLTRGDVLQAEITFIEGWTFRQMRERLDAHPDVRHETRGLTDQEIMRRIGVPDVFPEGRFFPDTYLFVKQSADIDILARAFRIMRERLDREWETRQPSLPYRDSIDALIMASII
ncbi:MAG: endolytic transglycosylase MltG, partial [Candidatus Accumulibacter sp.]|nr:endolytic transglycosylase MltG [Accumulibacter sp.]